MAARVQPATANPAPAVTLEEPDFLFGVLASEIEPGNDPSSDATSVGALVLCTVWSGTAASAGFGASTAAGLVGLAGTWLYPTGSFIHLAMFMGFMPFFMPMVSRVLAMVTICWSPSCSSVMTPFLRCGSSCMPSLKMPTICFWVMVFSGSCQSWVSQSLDHITVLKPSSRAMARTRLSMSPRYKSKNKRNI